VSVNLVTAPQNLKESIYRTIAQHRLGMFTADVCDALKKTSQDLGSSFEALLAEGRLHSFAGFWMVPETFDKAAERFLDELRRQQSADLRVVYFDAEAIAKAVDLPWHGKPLQRIVSLLESRGALRIDLLHIRLTDLTLELTPRQVDLLARAMPSVKQNPVNVLSPAEIARALVVPIPAISEILRLGTFADQTIEVTEQMYYSPEQIAAIQQTMREAFCKREFTASEARQALGTSRKYIIPILEYLDASGFTKRNEDLRTIA
jgi:selenocysteine-specific elongation factor